MSVFMESADSGWNIKFGNLPFAPWRMRKPGNVPDFEFCAQASDKKSLVMSAARMLAISRGTLYALLGSGQLSSIRMGVPAAFQ